MDPIENSRTVAQELVSYAERYGVDLQPLRKDFTFQKDRRWIEFWRKDALPCSGRVDEPVGTLHYTMQGTIAGLPSEMKKSVSAFRGAWSEAGTFDSLEQAFALLKAWLIDAKEVDELPERCVRRQQI